MTYPRPDTRPYNPPKKQASPIFTIIAVLSIVLYLWLSA